MAQSVLKEIRDEMFIKMQSLPIRYFDTNSHGDIMSYYTNDADTLRQMISQSLPNLFSSIVSMIAVFISMGAPEHMAHPHSAGVYRPDPHGHKEDSFQERENTLWNSSGA